MQSSKVCVLSLEPDGEKEDDKVDEGADVI